MGGNWLDLTENELVARCEIWYTVLTDTVKVAAFLWPQAEVQEMQGAVLLFPAKLRMYREVDSQRNKIVKNEAKAAVKRKMRDFANEYIRYNPRMSETDKYELGIHTRDGKRSPAPAPSTVPEAWADTSRLRVIILRFKDRGAARRAKPKGMRGAEVCWALLDRAPLSMEMLTHSEFSSNGRIELVFDESDRGKRLYFALRWVSTSGRKGPFSEIYSVIIP
jgi:hypothetical protein